MNTEKINDELYCGNWEEYMQYLEEAFQWLNKPAWCDPAQSRFHRTAYWKRKFEVFNVLTTAQEFSRKVLVAYTEAKNMFEGVGITAQSAENIEERLRQLCNEETLRSLREKYKTPKKYKQKPSLKGMEDGAESTNLEKTIDVTNLSDEQRLDYATLIIQTMDTGYMIETLIRCLTYIRNLMWDYRTKKPRVEDIIPMFNDLVPDWKFKDFFAKAQLAYIKEKKPILFKTEELTQKENLLILERLRDEHVKCAADNSKWGKTYRAYLGRGWNIMDMVVDLFHADGCERFLTHLAIIDRCEKEIEELRKVIEEQKEQECQERESEDVGVVVEEQKEQERSESESKDISIDAEPSKSDIFDNKVKSIIEILQGDDWFKKGYRYAIIWMTLEQYHNKLFKDAPSFREYMKQLGIEIPVGDRSITYIKSRALGRHPNWTWKPNNGKKEDENEIRKRNDLASRFEHEFNVMTKKESKN